MPWLGSPIRYADSVLVGHHARRAGVDPHLVLDRHALHGVALAELAVVTDEELGNDEAGDPLRPRRRIGDAGEDEVDDVVGEVVLAVGDEDLLAGDPPRPVVGGHRPRGQGTDVGAGLRLGEVHRAGPLARHHLRQIRLTLTLVAVVHEHVDRALGEQRAQREGHVRRRHHLLHGDADKPREATSAVLRRERHGRPPRLDVAPVGLAEALRRAHRPVVVAPTVLDVADAIERSELLLEEPRRLFENPLHRLRVGVLVAGELGRGRRGR